MIGIVVVSHSHELATAAVALASQMVPDGAPQIAVAAGVDDGGFGTDAAAISLAISAVDSPDGVLVLLDLGSAVLSSELAVEFLDADLADRVLISPAPLVEGLLAAVVSAATGAALGEVDQEARLALAAKTGHLDDADQAPDLLQMPKPARDHFVAHRLVWRTTIRNPHGIHVRPAAAIVTALRDLDAEVNLSNATTGRGPAPADSLSRITGLEVGCGQILEARIGGPDADAAREELAGLAAANFGEDLSPRSARGRVSAGVAGSSTLVHSIGEVPAAAERRAVLGVIKRVTTKVLVAGYQQLTPKEELNRFSQAAAKVHSFLGEIASNGAALPGIIEAQQMMLDDRELHHGVVSRITAGFSAPDAVDGHLTEMARSFDQFTDAYLRERGQDLRSLRRLLLLYLTGKPLAEEATNEPRIWVLDELDAATAMRLDPRVCLGVITIAGGSSGHGMLAAQARGIPVLAGCAQAEDVPDGQLVGFDPVTHEFWPHPDDQLRTVFDQRNAERVAAAEHALERAHEPAITSEGVRVLVEGNVGSLDDALTSAREGADGSGVVRTENIFANLLTPPTAEQQAEVFVRIGQALGGPITIRTWDAAGDKPLAFMPYRYEDNPALGERGIRAMRRLPELFIEQIRAVLLAARDIEVRLMVPMVTRPDEMNWAQAQIAQVRTELAAPAVPVGMMVEVPAAAMRAADFAGLVDFVSIGTNDLSQYTQAADRTNAAVREFARQDSAAMLDLVAATCAALPGIPKAVCGDLASDPAMSATLVRLGVRELSVRPGMVAEIKQAVRLI